MPSFEPGEVDRFLSDPDQLDTMNKLMRQAKRSLALKKARLRLPDDPETDHVLHAVASLDGPPKAD